MTEVALEPAEFVIDEMTIVLHRQVVENWLDEGEPSSQAFRPFLKDEGCVSVTRGDRQDAEAAYRHYTEVEGLTSVGVWGVTVGEARAVALRVVDDSATDRLNLPHHAYIDFRAVETDKKCRSLGRKLAAHSRERGCLHRPPAL